MGGGIKVIFRLAVRSEAYFRDIYYVNLINLTFPGGGRSGEESSVFVTYELGRLIDHSS